MADATPSCLDCGKHEGVEYRTTPDRTDGKSFPRCERCFQRRLDSSQHALELQSPTPPRWFDPSYAGERWDEE